MGEGCRVQGEGCGVKGVRCRVWVKGGGCRRWGVGWRRVVARRARIAVAPQQSKGLGLSVEGVECRVMGGGCTAAVRSSGTAAPTMTT